MHTNTKGAKAAINLQARHSSLRQLLRTNKHNKIGEGGTLLSTCLSYMGPAVLQKPKWGIKCDSGLGLHGLEEAPALLAISHALELVVPTADNRVEVLLTELLQKSALHVMGLLYLTLQALLELQPQG